MSNEVVSVPVEDCVPPRVQYSRSYVLLPQMEDRSEAVRWREAAAVGGAGGLQTMGHSADDAGMGPEEREVVAVNPDQWGEDLEEFFEEYYSGLEYRSVEAETPTELVVKLLPSSAGDIALSQTDPRWEGYDFGEHPGGGSLGEYGCLITSLAMILRKVYGKEVTPPILDQALTQALSPYTRDNLLIWETVDSLFSVFDATLRAEVTRERIEELEMEGWEIILHREDPSHFVYFEGWDEGGVRVIDPYGGKRETESLSRYSDLRAVKAVGGEPTPPPDVGPNFPRPSQILGFQQQRAGDSRDEYIARVRPGYWKLIGGMGEAHHLLSINPEMKIVYRHFENDWGKFVLADDKERAAEEFVATFRDSLEQNAEAIYGVEDLNEYIATNDYDTLEHVSGWVRAFSEELMRIGLPAVPVTFNTAVGNPQSDHICEEQGMPSQLAYMVGGVEATMRAGGRISYHAYYGARSDGYCTLDGAERRYYSMRALLDWDPHFREEGLHPRYLFTEGGAIHIAPNGGMPSAHAGWRDSECLDGDLEDAVRRQLQFRNLVKEWNREHGNRARGVTTFLHGGMGEWDEFDWAGEPSLRLAEILGGNSA